ncbi:MAG: deoxyuridine 5'-triphosphate nucleotidohydrolase [Candidatus Dojkabacteria bacterium]|nr:MAG: deoxyuridine 5'-triphosphate nucleotidohydrolase [Candidatus Dojkabacteria bacterium]
MVVKVKKLSPDANLPERKTKGSVGFDISCVETTVIKPGETKLLKTGIAIEIPEGTVGLIFPRSSLALKNTLDMPNSVGVIDCDYRGECMVALRNLGKNDVVINKGERIAQFVFVNFLVPQILESEDLSDTERDQGGFGSTGA